jgi:hypothetical protein
MAETATAPVVNSEEIVDRIRRAAGLFSKDLSAMDEPMLVNSFGGSARTGYDIAYEVTFINNAVATNEFGGEPPKGWMRAPEGQSKDAAIQAFNDSVDAVCAKIAGSSADDFAAEMTTPFGPTNFGFMANMLPAHIMYHSGQLNYIQTLYGDEAFHWA